MIDIEWVSTNATRPNSRNARVHLKKQRRQIADSIGAFGFLVPILIEDGGLIIAGLSEARRRALAIELADILVVEGLDISITGFAPVEIDQITTDFEEDSLDLADSVDPQWTNAPPSTEAATPGLVATNVR
jgi:hypothetical protein